jgi:hypothetical protein
VEVVGHDLRPPTRSMDGCGVDLEEFLRIDCTIVLLQDVRPKLGGPVDPPQVRSEGSTASTVRSNVIIAGGAALPLVSPPE